MKNFRDLGGNKTEDGRTVKKGLFYRSAKLSNLSENDIKILKELNSKEGKTIVMVTHDSMIASYCERILLIKDGKIEGNLEREDLSQKEFFYKIVDMTSKESQSLFSEIE